MIALPYDGFTARSKGTLNGRRDEGVLAAELDIRTIKLIRSLIITHGWEDDVYVKENGHTPLFFTTYPGVSMPAGSVWALKLATKHFQLAISDAQAASISLQLHTHTPVEAM